MIQKIKETENYIKNNLEKFTKFTKQCQDFLQTNKEFITHIKTTYNINQKVIKDLIKKSNELMENAEKIQKLSGEDFFREIKNFFTMDIGVLMDLFKLLFYQALFYTDKRNIYEFVSSSYDKKFDYIGKKFFLLSLYYKNIKNTINQFFFKDVKLKDQLVIDDRTELWDTTEMEFLLLPSDYYKVREYANLITNVVKDKIDLKEYVLLNQQVSELIKNAIEHGNKNDVNKKIKIWYKFESYYYKVIIEDEGEGFQNLEEWNEFNKKRNEAMIKQDMENILKYSAFKTKNSSPSDGGNALFAALEYWDSGLIYNGKRNKVLAVKYFYNL